MVNTVDFISVSNGRAEGASPQFQKIEDICIDSRRCGKNSLFVPLIGERTDGHLYIRQAVAGGAIGSLVNADFWENHREELHALSRETGCWFIVVDDTLSALQQTAAAHMRSLSGVVRIGITGSNGKTTTKELMHSVLTTRYNTQVNEGNLNSEIGLCLAALRVRREHEIAVFEMGMNRIGEMDILTDIVRPDYAVITNIGTAHIGLVGSKEGIAAEKKKIFSCFDGGQTGFIYEEEPFFNFLVRDVPGTMLPYGPKTTEGFVSYESIGISGSTMRLRGEDIRVPLIGSHNMRNCLAAVAVADAFDVPISAVKEGIEQTKALFGRGEVIEGPVKIIRDCYNANPESFDEAVGFLDGLRTEGKKIAVIGPMNELGEFSVPAHEKLGEKLAVSSCDIVLFTGEETRSAYEAFKRNRSEAKTEWTDKTVDLLEIIKSDIKEGDIILLKGSRTAELEKIGDELMETKRGAE